MHAYFVTISEYHSVKNKKKEEAIIMSKRIMFSLLLSLVLIALFMSCEQKTDKSAVKTPESQRKVTSRDLIVPFGAKLEKVTGD